MATYDYKCAKCGHVQEGFTTKLYSVDEDNARPPSERPQCEKCGAEMARLFTGCLNRPIWIWPPTSQVDGYSAQDTNKLVDQGRLSEDKRRKEFVGGYKPDGKNRKKTYPKI